MAIKEGSSPPPAPREPLHDPHHLSHSQSGTLSCLGAKKSPLVARIISGSIGSILTSLVVTPLEVAKVRTQTASSAGFDTRILPNSKARVAPCPKGCGSFVLFNGHIDCLVTKESFPSVFSIPSSPKSRIPSPKATGGVVSVLRNIFLQEGISGIYAGLRPTLIMAVPNTVLYFSIYEELIWRLRNNSMAKDEPPAWYFPLVAGAVARTVASTATAPFEFIRTRQAAGGSSSMWAELQGIVQTDGRGISALYQGLRPTLWRDVPFSAIYWFCIEEFRSLWRGRTEAAVSPAEQAGQEFINGAVSGMIAATFTTPFDVIKTRQQTASSVAHQLEVAFPPLCSHNGAIAYEHSSGRIAANTTTSRGTFESMRQIVACEGVKGLWTGNLARMLKVAPSCAIMISSYEFGKRIL